MSTLHPIEVGAVWFPGLGFRPAVLTPPHRADEQVAPKGADVGVPCPTVVRLLLRLDIETGVLFWKRRPSWVSRSGNKPSQREISSVNANYAGKEAFTCRDRHGYKAGQILGRKVRAHRVVWTILHGAWPNGEIDHINGDRQDNRPENLRSVSCSENSKNKCMRRDNTSGVTGVSWNKNRQKWHASIYVEKKSKHIGFFSDLQEAIAARKIAEQIHGYHPNHGRPA